MTNAVRVRVAERALDCSGLLGAREDESQIAGAFRQRHELLVGLRRDPHISTPGYAQARRRRRPRGDRSLRPESESSSRPTPRARDASRR